MMIEVPTGWTNGTLLLLYSLETVSYYSPVQVCKGKASEFHVFFQATTPDGPSVSSILKTSKDDKESFVTVYYKHEPLYMSIIPILPLLLFVSTTLIWQTTQCSLPFPSTFIVIESRVQYISPPG